jgi:hypothetical protein
VEFDEDIQDNLQRRESEIEVSGIQGMQEEGEE